MRTMLPIAVHRPMALGTYQLRLLPGNLLAKVIHECLAIDRVVTVQASSVDAMCQYDVIVFRKLVARRLTCRCTVAFTASIGECTNPILGSGQRHSHGRDVSHGVRNGIRNGERTAELNRSEGQKQCE